MSSRTSRRKVHGAHLDDFCRLLGLVAVLGHAAAGLSVKQPVQGAPLLIRPIIAQSLVRRSSDRKFL